MGIATTSADTCSHPAIIIGRVNVVGRVVADVEAALWLEAECLKNAPVESWVGLAEADLVRKEDGRSCDELQHVESDKFLSLFDGDAG